MAEPAGPALASRPRERLIAYVRLPHAVPVVVVVGACLAMTLTLAPHTPVTRVVLILAAMLGAQLVIGVVNELVDLPIDRATRPDKPLASGLVSMRGARSMLAAGAAMLLLPGALLGAGAFALCLAGCGIGVAYSVWFKRTALAWLPYLAALPLLPIYVAVATDTYRHALLWLYPLGACAVLAVQIAQSLPDIAADRQAGIVTLTTRLGERRSMVICGLAMVASALLLAAVGRDSDLVLGAAGLVVLAVAGAGVLYLIRPAAAVLAAFPVTAVATALLGVAWVYAGGS